MTENSDHPWDIGDVLAAARAKANLSLRDLSERTASADPKGRGVQTAQLSRFAVRHWQAQGRGGRIVHIASRAAFRGDSPAHWHYAAAKGGMIALHKTIARAYAGDDILSFAIAPGFTDTAMAGDYLLSRGGPALLADIPLGRVATPEEIASIAVFCALDAPPSMTGATIDANGASHVR